MDQQAETLHVDAWKCYTGSPPKGFEHGWWLSDEKIAYPEKAQALGITNIFAHKGLPLVPWPITTIPVTFSKPQKISPN